jgi:hypothetical protein
MDEKSFSFIKTPLFSGVDGFYAFWYWSSSENENNDNNAWNQNFNNGNQNNNNKDNHNNVRCVRDFKQNLQRRA